MKGSVMFSSPHKALFLLVALTFSFGAGPAQGADIVVAGACTLTDAVATAQAGASVGACVWSGDATVILSPGQTYGLTTALPAISTTVTVSTATGTIETAEIAWQGTTDGRHFEVASGGHLNLSNVKLKDGRQVLGGAVRVHAGGTLELLGVELENNQAWFQGGAVFNEGTLSIKASTFEGNDAIHGAAIYNGGAGTVDASSSLWVGQSASQGAVYQNGGSVSIKSSTFSANQADMGGALFNKSGDASFDWVTFRNNDAVNNIGGTVFAEWGTVELRRSALSATATQAPLCWGTFYISSAGYNAFSDASCGTLHADDMPVVGGEIPMSELIDHGGLTRVHVPTCDWSSGSCESPILDKVDDCCALGEACAPGVDPDRDQRDQFSRRDLAGGPAPSGGELCDIGAYESVCESYQEGPGTVTVMLHEFQIAAGPALLLDNGSCYRHPMFEAPAPSQLVAGDPSVQLTKPAARQNKSAGGCRMTWQNYGPRIAIDDVIFLQPGFTGSCFPDATPCLAYADNPPAGWFPDPDPNGSFAFDVPGCETPTTSRRYLLMLRDTTDPARLPWPWDPLTEVTEDDVTGDG